MSNQSGEILVGAGLTDYGICTGVVPPLSEDEIRTLEWGGVIESGAAVLADELSIHFTAVSQKVEYSEHSREEIIRMAQEHAGKIATAVEALKGKDSVRLELEPVLMFGGQSLGEPITHEELQRIIAETE
jgi:hypothetical protein